MQESTTTQAARKADPGELRRRIASARPHLEEAIEGPGSLTSLAIAFSILADVLTSTLDHLAEPSASEECASSDEYSIPAEAALELINWPKPPTSAARVLFGDFGPVRHRLIATSEPIVMHCRRCRAAIADDEGACPRCGLEQSIF